MKLLRLPQVMEKTGLARSTLYGLMKTTDFPAPIKIGIRAVAWEERDIDHWITTKKEAP